MLSSLLLAWLAVLFTVLSAVLYLIKRGGSRRLHKIFSRIHRTVGVLLIVTGIVHGVLAGNLADETVGDMMVAPLLFTWNWGTLSLLAAVLLAVSYMLRRRLKRHWMALHRVLTVAMIALVALHVSDVGIQLVDRLPAAVGYAETLTESNAADAPAYETYRTPAPVQAASVTLEAADADAIIAQAAAQFSGATLIDGVYEGSAAGYRGTITVSVTVSGGQVTGIEILRKNDTPSYFSRAKAVVETIVVEQSLEVDAVSGATYSSAGIVNAVSDALSTAVNSGSFAVTEFTYHSRRGH